MSITSFNQAPYFDDFNIKDTNDNNKTVLEKNYLRILFQPGFAVQTRELNQLQSILQNQIQQLGNVSLTEGQAILGEDLPQFTNNVSYIEFTPEADAPSVTATSITKFVDLLKLQKNITDNSTTAKILNVSEFVDSNVKKVRVFLAYEQQSSFVDTAAGDTDDIEADANCLYFVNGEFKNELGVTAERTSKIGTINKVGFGFAYSIRENVYYINGSFVHVSDQDVYFRKTDSDETVLGDLIFRVTENKVNSTNDSSLLDNANGSVNVSAPGADRYQIVLEPVFIDRTPTETIKAANAGATNVVVGSDSIGNVKRLCSNNTEGVADEPGQDNSIIGKALASRTSETDGNYIIQPFRISYREFFKDSTDFLNGVYSESQITANNPFSVTTVETAKKHYIIEIDTSIAYVNGNRYTYPPKVLLKGDKARDEKNITNEKFSIRYGHFVNITQTDSPADNTFDTTEIANIKSIKQTDTGITQIHTFNGEDLDKTVSNADDSTLLFEIPYRGVKALNDFEFIQTRKFTNVRYDSDNQIVITTPSEFLANEIEAGDETTYGIIDANGKLLIPGTDYDLDESASTTKRIVFAMNSSPEDHADGFTVYAPETKSGVSRSKTLQSGTVDFTAASGSTTDNQVESVVTLAHSDMFLKEGFSNISVIPKGGGAVFSTAKFRVIDDGQRSDKYVRPVIGIKGLTNGTACTLQYEYFSHGGENAAGGDYFEANSYPATIDYCDIPEYKGRSLADFIDFRIKETADTLDENVNQVIPRPNTVSTIKDMDIYLSRRDRLVITDTGNLEIIKGISSIDPLLPDAPNNSLTLYEIFVPYFTCDLQDIRNRYIDHSRYTQRQIGEIDQRLQRIEYDTALTSTEKFASERTFLNDAGTSLLFKSAFIADNFSGHSVGDTTQIDYLVAIDKFKNEARPYYKQKNFKFIRKFTTDGVTNEEKEDDVEEEVPDVIDPIIKYTYNKSDSVVDVKTQTRPNLITLEFDSAINDGGFPQFTSQGQLPIPKTVTLPLSLSTKHIDVYQTVPNLYGLRLVRYKNVPTAPDKFNIFQVHRLIERLRDYDTDAVTSETVNGRDRDFWHLHYHPNPIVYRRRSVSAYVPGAGVGRWYSKSGSDGKEIETGGGVHTLEVSEAGSSSAAKKAGNVRITRPFATTGADSTEISATETLSQIEEVNTKTESARNKKSKVVDGESTAEVASLWEGTTETLFEQQLLSQTIGVQPFEITNYTGDITLSPSSDEWVDTETRPAVVINNNGAMDAIEFLQNNNPELFEGVLGTEWNSWQTTVQSVDTIGQTRTNARVDKGRPVATIWDINQVTASQERTGVRTTLGSDTIQQDLGERVVDLNIIPFIRSRDIGFKVTGLKPGTQHYVFFDGEDVTNYCAPTSSFIRYSETPNVTTYNGQSAPDSRPTTSGGLVSGYVRTRAGSFNAYEVPLVSTMEQGDLTGVFRIPNNSDLRFKTGTREFKITSNEDNLDLEADSIASTTYTASGLLETKESQILSTRVPTLVQTAVQQERQTTFRTQTINRQFRYDPIAQTFLINESDYKNGVFVSDVDLFFAEKPDQNVDVEVYMVPTELGIPTQNIIPGSRVTKRNRDVKVSGRTPTNPSSTTISGGGIEATNFRFERPLHLKAGQEYALVVFSKSINYRVWTSVLGQKDLRTQNTITTNPSVGVFLKSQNTRTWTPDQLRDLTFKLNKCVFPVGSKEFVFETKISDSDKQGVDSFDFSLININDSVVKLPGTEVTHKLEFLEENETEITSSNAPDRVYESVKGRSNLTLESSINTAHNVKATVTLTTTDKDITPLFDMERYSLFGISNSKNAAAVSSDVGYVTKEVSLLNAATSIRVLMDIHKPDETDISNIRVYVNLDEDRFATTDTPAPLADEIGKLRYTEVPLTSADGRDADEIPVATQEEDFVPCEFLLAPPTGAFEKMRIKVVFVNTDSSKVCRIKNFAAFALV